jgi:hypothetical protein
MYTIRKATSEITIQDRPGCFWLFGLFFVLIGGIFVVGAAGLFSNLEEVSWPVRGLTFLLGMAAVGAGLYVIADAPRSLAVCDFQSHVFMVHQKGLLRRQTNIIPFDEIQAIFVEQSEDTDGGEIYRPALQLLDGQIVPVSQLWNHNRAEVDGVINELSRVLDTE